MFENKGTDNIVSLFGGFLKNAKTEIDAETIEALGVLREQFHTPDLSKIKKFEGARVEGISALAYFDIHYADVKDRLNGQLLSQYDRKLYDAMSGELRRDGGKSINDVVPSYDTVLEQRTRATAKLLGLKDTEHAGKVLSDFFRSIRNR